MNGRRGVCNTGQRSFHAGAVVRREIADRVLDAGQVVLDHGLHRVDAFVVPVRLVEEAPLALAPDLAQRVVAIACVAVWFLLLVLGAHLVVVRRS